VTEVGVLVLLCKNMKCKTAQYILKRYTTPERIAAVSKEVLGEEMRKRSMGKFGIQAAESLIGLARETVGIKEGLGGILMDLRHILMQLEAEARFIAEIDDGSLWAPMTSGMWVSIYGVAAVEWPLIVSLEPHGSGQPEHYPWHVGHDEKADDQWNEERRHGE
jgi:hypothetical protein